MIMDNRALLSLQLLERLMTGQAVFKRDTIILTVLDTMKNINQNFKVSEESLRKAKEWESRMIEHGFYREHFFQQIVNEIALLSDGPTSILEIGSGPGHLAEKILNSIEVEKYALFDLSESMNYIALNCLNAYQEILDINVGNFLDKTDYVNLNNFDIVVCMQTIHEAGDKNLAPDIYKHISETLKPGGCFLVCDFIHDKTGMDNNTMYMTIEEQREALLESGFKSPVLLSKYSGLTLYKAYC